MTDFDAHLIPCGSRSSTSAATPASGGYRRFAWTTADLTLREWFIGEAQRRGMTVEEDRNGNLWAWWMPAGWTGDPKGAFVTGSHLDSVPDGGAFDGPLGVVSAFHAIESLRPAALRPSSGRRGRIRRRGGRPVRRGVRGLAADHRGVDGGARATCAKRRHHAGRCADRRRPQPRAARRRPALVDRVGVYVELHVEQGRALELLDRPVAVASAIWPHGRWQFTFCGEANHAGTTRLVDRRDPMLHVRLFGARRANWAAAHEAVATFGKVRVTPNGANAIPSGAMPGWTPAPPTKRPAALVDEITAEARPARSGDGTTRASTPSRSPRSSSFPEPAAPAAAALSRFGDVPVLPTAAGHDAGILSAKVPTAMLFVRNPTGVSHSPDGVRRDRRLRAGAEALADVMADWVTRVTGHVVV